MLTGTLRWAVSAGRIWASPVLADDRIYIANLAGEIKALRTVDGSEIWSLSSGGIPFPTNLVVSGNLIAATDYYGRIAVAQDDGITAAWVYNTTLPDGDPPPSLPMVPSVLPASPLKVDPLGNLFVGADDGKIYQLDIATGAVTGHRTMETDATDVDEVLLAGAGTSFFAASLSGQIARFCAHFALPCEQDFESDGDVDGNDLVQEINAGGAQIDQIAGDFGRTDCPW